MQCPKCGTENPTGRTLCLRCGARLRAVAGAVAPVEPGAGLMGWLRADLTRLAVVTVVVIAAAVLLGLLLR